MHCTVRHISSEQRTSGQTEKRLNSCQATVSPSHDDMAAGWKTLIF